MLNDNKANPVFTRKKTILGQIGDYYDSIIYPSPQGVKLGGSKGEVYPSMTKKEVRNVARTICTDAYTQVN